MFCLKVQIEINNQGLWKKFLSNNKKDLAVLILKGDSSLLSSVFQGKKIEKFQLG